MGVPLKFIAGAVTGGIAAYKSLSSAFGLRHLSDTRTRKLSRQQIKRANKIRKR